MTNHIPDGGTRRGTCSMLSFHPTILAIVSSYIFYIPSLQEVG